MENATLATNTSGETLLRKANIASTSYNSNTRTVDAILSKGSGVARLGYIEELEISQNAIDLNRANSGNVKLLDTHNQFSIGSILGSIKNCRIESDALIGTLCFADTAAGRQAEGMVSRGELTGISIGYRVSKWEVIQSKDDQPEKRKATGWELLEASLVSVPADPEAKVRSLNTPHIIRDGDTIMEGNIESNPSTQFTGQQAIEFVESARSFGPTVENIAQSLVAKNSAGAISVEAARTALLNAAAEQQRAETAAVSRAYPNEFDPTFDNPAFLARSMSDAVYCRMSGAAPTEPGSQFMGMSVPQIAAEILAKSGERNVHRMSANQLLSTAWQCEYGRSAAGNHTTSMLPALLEDSGNRFLQDKFQAFESPIKQVGRKKSAVDFREITGVDLSGIGTLDEVRESGEIKFGYFKSRKESYRLRTYAKRFGLSREAIINDDLGAFADSMVALAKAGAEREALLLADLLNSNPNMSDNNAVFHSDHGNLSAAPGAPDIDKLSEARLAMRSQQDQDGTPVNVQPRFILSSAKHETAVEKLVATQLHPEAVSTANPFAGKLTPLIDPRLDDDPWYLFGDPGFSPSLEYAYLNDATSPVIEMQEAWDHLGTGYRAYHDFGCAFIDWRGAFQNPGA